LFFVEGNQGINQRLALQGAAFDAGVAGDLEEFAIPIVFVGATGGI